MVDRQQLGQEIAQKFCAVRRINESRYSVKSQSAKGKYDIYKTAIGWTCSCPDHKFRGIKCKHIFAVEFSSAIRGKILAKIAGTDSRKDCGKRFSFNVGLESMRAPPDAITSAMQLYFTGASFWNVMRFLKLRDVNVSHVAVYKWIRKYITLMQSYVEKIKLPSLGDAWRTDELYAKVKGNMKYMYALMDDETRFWIAQQVTGTKCTADLRPLFRKAKEVTAKRPNVLISDGARPHEGLKGETPAEKCGIKIEGENKWLTLIQNARKG